MVMSRDQNVDEVTILRLMTVPLTGWKSSNIWEQTKQINIDSEIN